MCVTGNVWDIYQDLQAVVVVSRGIRSCSRGRDPVQSWIVETVVQSWIVECRTFSRGRGPWGRFMRTRRCIPIPKVGPFSEGFKRRLSLGMGMGRGIGYGYVCHLPIHHYGYHNSGAGAEGARPTVVEAAEGRLHNGGWKGGKHSHTNHHQC